MELTDFFRMMNEIKEACMECIANGDLDDGDGKLGKMPKIKSPFEVVEILWQKVGMPRLQKAAEAGISPEALRRQIEFQARLAIESYHDYKRQLEAGNEKD